MSETQQQLELRRHVVRYLERAAPLIDSLRRHRLLLDDEQPTAMGVRRGGHQETWPQRERRLGSLHREVLAMVQLLSLHPAPDHWHGNRLSTGGTFESDGGTELWRRVIAFYFHYAADRHLPDDIHNWAYLEMARPERFATLERTYRTGINIVVSDPGQRPHDWTRLSPSTSPPGIILEVERDLHGNHFYRFLGGRTYLLRAP